MNRKKFENYDDFIKKFNKPGGHKLTTDDCYLDHFIQAVITKNLTTLQIVLLLIIRHSQFLQAFVSGT